jgi:hypothetical protein
MRYVILRDDDTNALTPIDCLERLYRPFRERALPVNLAVIPHVRTDLTLPDGRPEGFLLAKEGDVPSMAPIACNVDLADYLRRTPGYHIVQHGCHHEAFEFDRRDRMDVVQRLKLGSQLLIDAGFPWPHTFVAPHDRLSRTSFEEVARRFSVLSTGWFELRRLPFTWWPRFIWKKMSGSPHWRIRRTLLLSHPGCLLSYRRPYDTMLEAVKRAVEARPLTVLVTHWWEYFRDNQPDEAFIGILHQTADWLASRADIRVITFEDLAQGRVPV